MNAKEGSFGKPFLSKRFVGIAIVLCLLFLVAIPGIAAEQTTQKVSASEVTTTSEDDYVLGIYGNANEDDTIDMRDLTYVKLIFFGKKSETELADAKYDGKINPLDFIQIKLIIVGKEKELTIVDSADRIVTVKKPIARAVVLSAYHGEAVRALGAKDKIVGVADFIGVEKIYFPEFSKLPGIGMSHPLDYEAILSLNPDLVTTARITWAGKYAEQLQGTPVVGFYFYRPDIFIDELMKLGYIFGKEDEAKHYIDDFHSKYQDFIKARTEGLLEEERPKVYVEYCKKPYSSYGSASSAHQMIEICGGRNIFADMPGWGGEVDPEAVMEKNPDIIIKRIGKTDAGYEYAADDTSKIETLWESSINRPELADVNAVKNGRVYIIDTDLQYGLDTIVAMGYTAKWIHPELFEDLDPKAIHQQFLRFQGLDYDLDNRGVFVYPPLSG